VETHAGSSFSFAAKKMETLMEKKGKGTKSPGNHVAVRELRREKKKGREVDRERFCDEKVRIQPELTALCVNQTDTCRRKKGTSSLRS